MNQTTRIIRSLKEAASGKRLFSIFLPALLWGDFVETQAADNTRRVYQPTAAQLRVMQQQREQEARIQAIRNQQKSQNAAVVRPVQKTPLPAAAVPVRNTPAVSQKTQTVLPPVQTAAPTRIRYIWYKSVRFALVQDIARYYGMKISYTRSGLVLKSPRDILSLQYNKRLAVLNRVSIYLTHPPLLRGALVYLDEKDFLLTIDPVIRNAPLWKHPLKTVLIDPGHGGKDQGAPGIGGILEKNITLKMGHNLAGKLRKCGFRVFMTRTDDRNMTLQQRVAMCENLKPDLFISVHCNAVANRRTMGVETYAATPQGAASTSDSKPVKEASAGNSFNRNNYRLAYEVQKNLLAFTRAPDRGVRHARFFVIRHAVCPAILIETGFVTHPKEGPLLNSAAYQEKLVNGIVSGILAYSKASALPVKTSSALSGRQPVPKNKSVPGTKSSSAVSKRPAVSSAKQKVPAIKISTKIVKKPVQNP